MQAAIDRCAGPAGNLPGLDLAEHFALLCIDEAGATACVQKGAARLMQDVLLCTEEDATRMEDLEGKRWAMEAFSNIAANLSLRPAVTALWFQPSEERRAMQAQLKALQVCEHPGARAAAMRLYCCLNDNYMPYLLGLGEHLVNAILMTQSLWRQWVLLFVLGSAPV